MLRTALLISLALATVASAREEMTRPPKGLDGAALAEHLRTEGCPGCMIYNANLSGQNLDGANLEGAHLVDVDLSSATCRGCNLQDGFFSTIDLRGADLGGADLRGLINHCSGYYQYNQCLGPWFQPLLLRGANLEGVDMTAFDQLDLTDARVEGALFHVEFPPTLTLAEFQTVRLAPKTGSGAAETSFTRADISGLAQYVVNPPEARPRLDYTAGTRTVHAPSFDCSKASTDTERALCNDRELALLDRMIAAGYKAAKNAEGADGAALEKEQRSWLGTRDACGEDRNCLDETMRSRIKALGKAAGPVPVRTGRYEPSYAEPVMAPDLLATEVGKKLHALMRHDETHVTIHGASGGTLTVEHWVLGYNTHSCGSKDHVEFRYDPALSAYYSSLGDGSPEEVLGYGNIVAFDRYLLFSDGRYLCGAYASLVGVFVLPE